jgi:hypothetical protein
MLFVSMPPPMRASTSVEPVEILASMGPAFENVLFFS